MDKLNFYTLFKEYVNKYYGPGHEKRDKNILAICDKQPELLIMPCYDKSYYGVAAELIVRMGYEKFKNHIEEVFVWVQDLNWPSAEVIAEFLASIPRDELIEHLKNILRLAYEQKDDCWISGINYIINRAKLSKYFLDNDEFGKILKFGGCLENSDEDIEKPLEIVDFESEFQANLNKYEVTAFDVHFCSKEEMGRLINSIALWNIAQTEEEKHRIQSEIHKIREGYKFKYRE